MGFQAVPATQDEVNQQDLVNILLASSNVFGSTYAYDWNPVVLTEQQRLQQAAQQQDLNTGDTIAQEALAEKLALRNRSLYRHGQQHDKESWAELGLALLDNAPSTLVLEPQNTKNGNRFEYLIFNQDKTNYYVKYTDLKNTVFSLALEKEQYEKRSATLHAPAVMNAPREIEEAPTEDPYLRAIYSKKTQRFATYEDFLVHLRKNRMTELTAEQRAVLSPLYLCYVRREAQLQKEIAELRSALNPNWDPHAKAKANWKKVKTAIGHKQRLEDHEDTQAIVPVPPATQVAPPRPAYRSFREVVRGFIYVRPTTDQQASRLAALELELENYASYEDFLDYLQQSPELANDDEFEAYGQFVEEELKKTKITSYGWGNEDDHITHLRPNNKTAFVDASLKSAPEVSILTLISKAVPEASVNLSFGIAANVLLIPLFFYNFHESVEMAKYQKNNHGERPDELSEVFQKIQKDRKVLCGQTFMAAVMGTFIMNKGLHHELNFNPMEHLINGLSPGSLVPGELTSELRAAALQSLPWWVNLSAAAICGATVGLTMMAFTLASTWKDEEFSWMHVSASFALGFAAGSLMYASSACNASNNKAVSDVFGLVINGMLGLGLQWAFPKNRYMTLDQKAEATRQTFMPSKHAKEAEPLDPDQFKRQQRFK